MSQNIRKSLAYVMCMITIGVSYNVVKPVQQVNVNSSFTVAKYDTIKTTMKVSYVKKTH